MYPAGFRMIYSVFTAATAAAIIPHASAQGLAQHQAGTPAGMTAANADYARAFAETARRAVLRCQPLKLPAELYDLWGSVEINFDPEEMT